LRRYTRFADKPIGDRSKKLANPTITKVDIDLANYLNSNSLAAAEGSSNSNLTINQQLYMFNSVPLEYLEDFDTWRNLTNSVLSEGLDLGLWHDVCGKARNFYDSGNRDLYDRFKTSRRSGKAATIDSFKRICFMYNKSVYSSLFTAGICLKLPEGYTTLNMKAGEGKHVNVPYVSDALEYEDFNNHRTIIIQAALAQARLPA
jgi:hypothetical protein